MMDWILPFLFAVLAGLPVGDLPVGDPRMINPNERADISGDG